MSGTDDPRIEALARDLCVSEGWEPDETIACERDEVPGARFDSATGECVCLRWQVYAGAAAHRLRRLDDWEVF